MNVTYDVFISHNRKQKPWVRELVSFLRALGLKVFFDEDSIIPGEDVVAALERAIESSDSLVLVISRSSVFSKWVSFETTMRIYEDPDMSRRRLIPILVEPVDRTMIRPSVRRLDAVDLTDPLTREREFHHFLHSFGLTNLATAAFPPWPEPSPIDELHVADVSTVQEWRWDGCRLLEALIALDYELFSKLTPEQEGHVDQWAPVFMDHPDTWRLLTTATNEIVGYWHFVPLFAADHQAAVRGELLDSEITADRVRLFELPGSYPIYFVSVGLVPRLRRTKAYKLLLESFFDVLLSLAENGIYVDAVCANAFSPSGASLCKSFGLTRHGQHTARGEIFTGSMSDLLAMDICEPYAALRSAYASRHKKDI